MPTIDVSIEQEITLVVTPPNRRVATVVAPDRQITVVGIGGPAGTDGGGGGVSLGETSSTAYRGDRGKTAYDHSQTTGNPHSTTAAQVGADPAGSASTAQAAAIAAAATDATTKANAAQAASDPAGTASTAVTTHTGATDPHGDRAYAASLVTGLQPLDSDLTAIAALTTTSYGRSLLALADAAAARTALGLGTAATSASSAFDAAGAAASAQAASQPLDSDLTAIAALTTTSFGRGLLGLADVAALRSTANLGTNAPAITIPSGNWVHQLGIPAATGTTYTQSRLFFIPYLHTPSQAITGMRCYITTGVAATTLRFGLYAPHATTGYPDALMYDSGTFAATASGAVVTTGAITQNLHSSGITWLAVVAQGGAPTGIALQCRAYLIPGFSLLTAGPPVDANSVGIAYFQASVTGSLPSTATSPPGTSQAVNIPLIQVQV